MKDSGKVYDLKKDESHDLKEIITLLAFLYDDEYNCIILDEPELNLHPPSFSNIFCKKYGLWQVIHFKNKGKRCF